MEFKNFVSYKCLGLILLLCISRVCHAQLKCYVCDNCAQITAETPQFECNEEFFNTGGPTDSSIQTTTEPAKTTPGVTEDNDKTTKAEITSTPPPANNTEESTMTTTTTMKTTTTTMEPTSSKSTTKLTTESSAETSTEMSAETTTLQVSETTHGKTNATEEQTTLSPMVGPFNSSSGMVTSLNVSTVQPLDNIESLNNKTIAHEQHVNMDEVEDVDTEPSTTKAYKPSAEFRIRQVRSVVSDVTYHCFNVQATTVNGSMVVNRGCSRVQTKESVCAQWQSQHPNEKMTKCYPCSRTKCNGSSALNVSITAVIVAVVAVFMQRK